VLLLVLFKQCRINILAYDFRKLPNLAVDSVFYFLLLLKATKERGLYESFHYLEKALRDSYIINGKIVGTF